MRMERLEGPLGNVGRKALWGEGAREIVPGLEHTAHVQESFFLRVVPKALGLAFIGLF